jgi:stress response protein SCP2
MEENFLQNELRNLPEILNLGEFPSNSQVSFLLNIKTACVYRVISKIHSLEVFPHNLQVGENTLSIIISPVADNIFIFGEVVLIAENPLDNKKIMVSGKSKTIPYGYYDNKIVFDATNRFEINENINSNKLNKNQNVTVNNLLKKHIEIKFDCLSNLRELDVEAYAFLLNENDMIESEDDFIFFGRTKTEGISYEDKIFKICLNDIKFPTKKVIIAYSLYNTDETFSLIHLPEIKIFIDYTLYFSFPLSLNDVQTVIALEFYQTKNTWRLNALGAEYDSSFSNFCAACGISIK